jgi:four helix bundle protein
VKFERERGGRQNKANFIAKYSIACKEAHETHYWLRLLAATDILPADRLSPLEQECNELIAILTTIIKKSPTNTQ